MPARIRLQRHGKKNQPFYHIVVADGRAPRDGKFIEKLGTYNPMTNPATIVLNEERACQWLKNGASPSDTVRRILSYKGVLLRRHLQIGVEKGAITQEVADARFTEWKQATRPRLPLSMPSAAPLPRLRLPQRLRLLPRLTPKLLRKPRRLPQRLKPTTSLLGSETQVRRIPQIRPSMVIHKKWTHWTCVHFLCVQLLHAGNLYLLPPCAQLCCSHCQLRTRKIHQMK